MRMITALFASPATGSCMRNRHRFAVAPDGHGPTDPVQMLPPSVGIGREHWNAVLPANVGPVAVGTTISGEPFASAEARVTDCVPSSHGQYASGTDVPVSSEYPRYIDDRTGGVPWV